MAENGCSLEDCHTNLFALADLAGIKWRRLNAQSDASYSMDPLEDPVLTSYSKCVQADLLCVWRRQPKGACSGGGGGSGGNKNVGPTDQGPATPKELWLFWYGEEPASLQSFISPDLYEVESGSWETVQLSYECRTLLFKALHNLIERCLLSQNFVRVGKWFVQPYSDVEQLQKNMSDRRLHFSMSFNFFLHGDSTVCVSVDVRQHPSLFSLSNHHLNMASQFHQGTPVLLAPYGLSGQLTGRSSGDSDPKAQQLLEEWKRFYHVNKMEDSSDASGSLPSVVEVVVAGVRLRYPSSYVLVALEVELEILKMRQSSSPSSSPQSSMVAARETFQHKSKARSTDMRQNTSLKVSLSKRIVEKSWQDWIVASGLASNSQSEPCDARGDLASANDRVSWNFGDPTQKGICGCPRLRSNKHLRNITSSSSSLTSSSNKTMQSLSGFGSGNLSPWKQQLSLKGSTEHRPRHHKTCTPYHRRNKNASTVRTNKCTANYSIPHNLGLLPPKSSTPASSSFASSSNSSTFQGADHHGNQQHMQISGALHTSKSILQQMTGGLDSSPNSAAPSPLMATTQGHLSSVGQNGGDPTMPTLSPQPTTKGGVSDGRSNTKEAGSSEANFRLSSARMTDSNISLTPFSSSSSSSSSFSATRTVSLADVKVDPEGRRALQCDLSRSEVVVRVKPADVGKTWLEKQMKRRSRFLVSSSLKRPSLNPLFQEDDDDDRWRSLYEPQPDPVSDYLTHRRPGAKGEFNILRNRENLPDDLHHFADNGGGFAGSRMKDCKTTLNVKDEFSSILPHIKSEVSQQGGINADGQSNGYDSRNAIDMPPSPTGRPASMTTTLMRENDLIPNIHDLEKMFDTDEEGDPDSPSVMMKPEKMREDIYGPPFRSTSTSANHNSLAPNQGVLTTKELSRMYPTPPSADNPCSEPSPMMQGGNDPDAHHDPHHFVQQPPLIQHLQHQYSSSQLPFIKEELGSISVALAGLKKEYASLYKMPLRCRIPASSDYDPIELPQDARPVVQPGLVYKPQTATVPSLSLQQHQSADRHTSTSKFVPSSMIDGHVINASNSRRTEFVAPFFGSQQHSNSMNPMLLHQQQHLMQQQRTPLSYELMSPASNASSLNRPINSIDNSHPGSTGEVSSLVVNIVLSDSMLNIFKDHNFDSCTICACNSRIDGSDINSYLVPHGRSSAVNEDQFRCTCAFSAIINRRYGLKSGLFYEDEVEITGIYHSHFDNVYKPNLLVHKNQDKQQQQQQQQHQMGNNTNNNNNNSNNNGSNVGTTEDEVSQDVFTLLREQFSTQFPSMSVMSNFKVQTGRAQGPEYARNLEMKDCNEACYTALEFSRQMTVDGCNSQSFVDRNKMCLHSWPFYQAPAPVASNSQEVVRLLKQLQPLLQDAIQKKRTTRLWESVYTISGPLTWKDFHLLAGRGSKETSEPKSIPYLLVGHDKEWLALSPHAIKHWDKLMLEPLSEPRDVLYLVVAPDNDLILNHATTFFNELGVLYEQCKLGRHRVLNDKMRGGIVRVGKKSKLMVEEELEDGWFRDVGDSPSATKLRLYAKICCKLLVNLLVKSLMDKRAMYEEAAKSHSAAGGSRFSISNPDQPPSTLYGSSHNHSTGISSSVMQSRSFGHSETIHPSVFSERDHAGAESAQRDQQPTDPDSHEASEHNSGFSLDVVNAAQMPYVVIYVVDPFAYGEDREQQDGNERLAFLGILRMFHNMIKVVPEHLRSSIQLQIVPQQVLLSVSQPTVTQTMKSLCFSVYTACRRSLKHATLGRTLTGFGPAATANKLIKKLNPSTKSDAASCGVVSFSSIGLLANNVAATTLYCPPYILAPPSIQSAVGSSILPETWKEPVEKSGILLCAYCLSEDQRFLLASLVDATGELLETTCIDIDVPNRSTRRRAAVRRFALQKLWDFILGVITCTTRAWRLVVGRFGRLGHGELKGWSTILSKRNLLASSHHLHRICKMCNLVAAGQCPGILSACLVSTELHPTIHVMIDSVKREENQSSKRQLSTPRDASCTHILVYPTSATVQGTDSGSADTHIDFTATELLNEEALLNEFDNEEQEIHDFWCNFDVSPNQMEDNISPHGDPNSLFGGPDQPGSSNHSRGAGMSSLSALDQEEINNLNLLQQPQAMGFYMSTAQPGPLPQWFWSSCPQREGHCPVCFKASLHLHCPMVQQNQDDLIHQSNAHNKKAAHPLDSNLTCDVLRYVLETYNTLSWLTIDPSTNDRRSCLPVHMLVLMQLYHGIKTFV